MVLVLRPWLRPSIGLAMGAGVALAGPSACHLVGGTDGLFIVEEDGGSGPVAGSGGMDATTATTSTSATGGAGGATSCEDLCAQPADCYRVECPYDECQYLPSQEGTLCDGGYCDGMGFCVACLVDNHCDDAICVAGQCVDGGCEDRVQTGDETGVDCGGPCPPCDNNVGCAQHADCKSGICNQLLCTPCGAHGECAGTHYCDLGATGFCLEKQGVGAPCSNAYECKSGNCEFWFDGDKYCYP